MKKIILTASLFFSLNVGWAQFNTIQKTSKPEYIFLENIAPKIILETELSVINETDHQENNDTLSLKKSFREVRERAKEKSKLRQITYKYVHTLKTEGLTIKELYAEIIKNDIKHPKIVLAQAILETGWFKSSVCRNKGNLFGLTNPKTGKYYEFNHWKESVKAYKEKVQYKYKGGNYLLWLRQIGYAEDPRYVSSLVKILEQYFI